MKAFSPRITIDISPSSFVFTSARATIQLDTYLYVLDTTHERPLVLSVGEEVSGISNAKRVELFESGNYPSTPDDKSKHLEAFLNYGLYRVRPLPYTLFLLIRPVVIFRDAEALEPIFGGYQQGILEHLARKAGASEVLFE